MKPWEEYAAQAPSGPWDEYAQPNQPQGLGRMSAPQELTAGEQVGQFLSGGILEKALNAIGPYARGFVQGAADPVVGTAQLAANLLPQNRGLSSLVTGQDDSIAGRMNRAIADKERQSEQLGTSGVARFVGNVASPVNLAIASRFTSAPSALQSAGLGAISGAMQPVVGGNSYAAEKAQQVGVGGILGGVGGAAINAVSKALSPQMSAAQRLLADEGVDLTPGQLAGGIASRLEEKLQSTPFVGGAITEARGKGIEQFNKATLNRALAPIGKSTDKIGREGFAEVKQTIGQAYDDVLSKINVTADQQFVSDLANLRSMAQNLPKAQADQFDTLLENLVLSRFTQAGKMSGETMKKVESELGRKASNYMRDASADARDMGAALKEAQNILRQTVMRSNPNKAGELQKINEAFAQYARIRRATTALGAEDGVFTPAQLLNAVKAEDKTVGKGSFGQGKALLQDLAEAGKNVLGNKVPNSGTADRLAAQLSNPLAIAGSPVALAAGIPASVLYSQPVNRLLNRAVLSGRGQRAMRMADLLRTGAAPAVLGISGAVQ